VSGARGGAGNHARLAEAPVALDLNAPDVAIRSLRAAGIQPKLDVSPASDRFEREADRVAAGALGKPLESAGPLLRAPSPTALPSAARVPSSVREAIAAPGRPLGEAVRHDLEPHLGLDLSAVRVHTDGRAARAARAVRARAFTVGRDVAFGAGEFRLGTRAGRLLLAHELAHVAQQARGGTPAVQRQPVVVEVQTDETAVRNYVHGFASAEARADLRRRAFSLAESGDLAALRRLAGVARDAAAGPAAGEILDRAGWVESLMSRTADLVERQREGGTPVASLLPSPGAPTGSAPAAEEMSYDERQNALIQLVSRLGSAETHFVAALTTEREAIEATASAQSDALKAVVGVAFTFFLTPAIGRALSTLANTISLDASVTTYRIAIALDDNASQIAGAISAVAKPRATAHINRVGQPPADYQGISSLLATAFSVGKDDLVGHVRGHLDNRDALPDEDLLILVAAWDPSVKTQAVYRQAVRDVLGAFRAQVLRIGERQQSGVGTFFASGTRRSVRWVQTSGSRRLAVVSIGYPGGGHGRFVTWVDPAFERAAIQQWLHEPVARNIYGGRIDADEPQTVTPGEIGAPAR
jgi:hypothetical protein